MSLIKVKGQEYLCRDTDTNAIINMDVKGYDAYIQSYKKAYNESQRIKTLESDVSEMKSDLNEIKNLLRNLANGS